MKLGPLRTTIEHAGQPYVDDPVFVHLEPKPIANGISLAFNLRRYWRGVFCIEERRSIPAIKVLDHYKHIRLRWMTPGPDGKLVPK